jgi:hypothetical protein
VSSRRGAPSPSAASSYLCARRDVAAVSVPTRISRTSRQTDAWAGTRTAWSIIYIQGEGDLRSCVGSDGPRRMKIVTQLIGKRWTTSWTRGSAGTAWVSRLLRTSPFGASRIPTSFQLVLVRSIKELSLSLALGVDARLRRRNVQCFLTLRTRTGRLVLVGLYSSPTEGYLEYDRRERKSIRSISSEFEVRGLHYFRLSTSNMTLLRLIC